MQYFEVQSLEGLTEKEAQERLKNLGPNELPTAKKRSVFYIAFEVVKEPMFLLLVACGTIYLVLGDIQEALMLLGFVFAVMGITIYQERKTERALEALRDLSSPRALVIRDGAKKRIAGRDVVLDDILILSEGDRVPADALLLFCSNFSVDESLLTGESVPVRKTDCGDKDGEMGKPGGDDLPYVYSGTLVVSGQGVAKVKGIGAGTEIGKIGKALRSIEEEDTQLQKQTSRLVKVVALVGLALCLTVFVIYGATRADWIKGLLAGITLAMAMLPEEFPVVLTIFLALGAWRISQNQVLTRRVPAIETLGAATVLCVDKTGTLTQNKMTVCEIFSHNQSYRVQNKKDEQIPEPFHQLMEFSILASLKNPFEPMDMAINSLGEMALGGTEHVHDDWELVQEYPLSKELLALSNVWRSSKSKDFVVAAKGAPEAVADLCHMEGDELKALEEQVQSMAKGGMRVLGVAKAHFHHEALPRVLHDFKFEFLGLVGFTDPVREAVPKSISECYGAGIRVIMITGDYPATAQKIAKEIGLKNSDSYITGNELERTDDGELKKRIKSVNIFARVVPEQKLRIVQALKANGEVVAMTGDGVNDAPALKAANIGIAMGGRGTDVARESASLVLLDDDFSSIVKAVRLGRRVYTNLQKAMAYIVAIHVPIAGLSLLPILLGWEIILWPVHIVFLELLIDPACSVVFEAEAEEKDVMDRPPRSPKEPLFGARALLLSVLQGVSVLAIVLIVYYIALQRGLAGPDARALAFTTLIIANLGLIMTNRSWTRTSVSMLAQKNAALWWVVSGAVVFLGLVLYVPFLKDLFHFDTLHPVDLLICLGAGFFSVIWFELLKKAKKWK